MPDHRNDEDRIRLEQMTSAGLEELLVQDFRAPEGGESDGGTLYQAAQTLADRDPDACTNTDRAWASFRENYLPFAKGGGSPCEDGDMPSSDDAPGRPGAGK